jgi:hypothetical protein
MKKKDNREDLTELFGLCLSPREAKTACEEVRAAERILESYPAPLPADETLNQVQLEMRRESLRRHRAGHFLRGVASVAAAIVIVGIAQHGLQGTKRPFGVASLIPAALWETNDMVSDDARLAYFDSEVDRLEVQVQAIESSDSDTGAGALNEVETELFQIDSDFWKG